jgi:hypothetical protein
MPYVRVTLLAPAWTAKGWSADSPGLVYWATLTQTDATDATDATAATAATAATGDAGVSGKAMASKAARMLGMGSTVEVSGVFHGEAIHTTRIHCIVYYMYNTLYSYTPECSMIGSHAVLMLYCILYSMLY